MNNPDKNILIVDDSPEDIELLKRYLKDEPYSILTTTDGMEALRRMEEIQVDVVLIDINMPGMNGLELIKEINDSRKPARILLMSDFSDKEKAQSDLIKAKKHGASGAIMKSSTKQEFIDHIEAIL